MAEIWSPSRVSTNSENARATSVSGTERYIPFDAAVLDRSDETADDVALEHGVRERRSFAVAGQA